MQSWSTISRPLVFLACVGLLSACAGSGPTDTPDEPLPAGQDATNSQEDVWQDIDQLKARALLGDPVAQTDLGYAYDNGVGVAPDGQAAVYWYKKAAEQGFAIANFNLGTLYLGGRHVAQDYAQAAIYFQSAAAGNHATAQLELGRMYRYGVLDGVDTDRAIKYFEASASQGNAAAAANLGDMHFRGIGFAKDEDKGKRMLFDAAERGAAYAQFLVAQMYFSGEHVEKDIDESNRWLVLSAEKGSPVGQSALAWAILQEDQTALGYQSAYYWAEKAASASIVDAIYLMGVIYESETFEGYDPQRALEWFLRAARAGDVAAQYWVSTYFVDGKAGEPDLVEGLAWASIALDAGNDKAASVVHRYSSRLGADDRQRLFDRIEALRNQLPAPQ